MNDNKENITSAEELNIACGKSKKKNTIDLISALVFILIAFLVLGMTVFVFINNKLNKVNYDDGSVRVTGSVSPNPEDTISVDEIGGGDKAQWDAPKDSTIEIAENDEIFNLLLLGTDERDWEFSDDARADCVMLLSINYSDETVKLISLERGIGMPILWGENEGYYDLITHIFKHGGAEMVVDDVRDCLKVDVNDYVRVNLNAFIKAVDVIGGIEVELDAMEAWYLNRVQMDMGVGPYLHQGYYRGENSSKDRAFVSGKNHMDGTRALAYARLRGIDDDWHRVERQRNVIRAIITRLRGADLRTMNALFDELLPLVKTDLTKKKILELLIDAPDIMFWPIEQITIPILDNSGDIDHIYDWSTMNGLYGQAMIALDFDYYSKFLRDYLNVA